MNTNAKHGSETIAAFSSADAAMGPWLPSAYEAEFESLAALLSHSEQEGRLAQSLLDVPETIRASSPYFVMFHGDLLVADREDSLACELYRRALALNPTPELGREIEVRLFAALTRLGKQAAAAELMQRLEPAARGLMPYGQALWGNYRGVWHWRRGEIDAANSAMTAVLAIPEQKDRRVTFTQFRARYALCAARIDLAAIPEAADHADCLVDSALRHDFRSNLLIAFVQRLNARLLDQHRIPSLDNFVEVPAGAFDHATSAARFDFVTSFGIRALCLGQLTLAHSLFMHQVSDARRASLTHRVAIARFWLMHVLVHQGSLDAAFSYLAEIRALSAPRRFLANLWPSWASLMLQTGHLREAEDALSQIDAGMLPEDDRLRVSLYRLVADVLADDHEAAPRLRRFLDGPEGEKLKCLEARLLSRVGISEALPLLCLKVLGQPCLQVGEAVIEFPRRKVISLLALLAIHPGGMTSEDMIANLFPESEDLEPDAALRKAVYLARHMLKAAGMLDPIERVQGRYRLRHERFALIDCQELETLHRKALECERSGHLQGARLFHQLVVWMGSSPPFDGLSEPCFVEPRERLVAICDQSRAFLHAKEVAPSAPLLLWEDAWALLERAKPELARRIRALVQAPWVAGDEGQAWVGLEALLIETSLGDRLVRIARGIVLAHACLMALSREAPEALAWTERLVDHASRYPGEVDRLLVRAIWLHSRRLDESENLALESLLEISPDWLASPDPTSLGTYLAAIGNHFIRAGHSVLASRLMVRMRQGSPSLPSPLLDLALALGEEPRPTGGGVARIPLVHLRWFGEPAVMLEGEAIRFPRKKCLALVALLALHPQGLGVETIFALLYPEVKHANAKKTIYTLVATTRQALDAEGAADLIVSLPGLYRLRGERLMHCDQQAFDMLYARASELERLGCGGVAPVFYRMAADLAERGPLFEGLHEPCFEELRRSRQTQALHAASKSLGLGLGR